MHRPHEHHIVGKRRRGAAGRTEQVGNSHFVERIERMSARTLSPRTLTQSTPVSRAESTTDTPAASVFGNRRDSGVQPSASSRPSMTTTRRSSGRLRGDELQEQTFKLEELLLSVRVLMPEDKLLVDGPERVFMAGSVVTLTMK